MILSGSITPDYYLKIVNKYEIECWYRNKDEYGKTENVNTGWEDPYLIIKKYKKVIKNQ